MKIRIASVIMAAAFAAAAGSMQAAAQPKDPDKAQSSLWIVSAT
jgi:hypothetical protein